jgi:hypothetical protein
VQQVALDQRLPQPGLEPVTLQVLAADRLGGEGGFSGGKASRQFDSVAAVTPSPRETVSRSSPRSKRITAVILRCRDILPRGRAPLRQTLAVAPRRPAAPHLSSVRSSTPPSRKSSYEVSQPTVQRESGDRHGVSRCERQLANLLGCSLNRGMLAIDHCG